MMRLKHLDLRAFLAHFLLAHLPGLSWQIPATEPMGVFGMWHTFKPRLQPPTVYMGWHTLRPRSRFMHMNE
jgi:hypothetical protein